MTRALWVASGGVLAGAACFAVALAVAVDVVAGLTLAGVELVSLAYAVAYLDARRS